MVQQVMYEAVADDFFTRLAEEGVELRNCDGTLFTYNGGAWGVISAQETAQYDKWMYECALEHAFPIAEKHAALWKSIKFRTQLLSADTLDTQPLLALPNGTLNPISGELYEHDPDDYTTRRLAIPYDPQAKCPEWLKMLDRVLVAKSEETREEYLSFLQEFFGMACIGFKPGTPRDLRKALILYGPAGTAKTSLADVLREFFLWDEVCSDNVDQLSSRFGLSRLASSRALIADDAVGVRSKADPKVLKKIITGEPMMADRKNKDLQQFRFRGPVVFTTNIKPEIRDETDALFDRTVLLTFEHRFTSKDKEKLGKHGAVVPFLKAHDEFSGILNWALDGMVRAVELRRYSAIVEAQESSRAWRAENDVVFDFVTKFCTEARDIYCSVSIVSRMLSVFSEEEHHQPLSPNKAARQFMREVSTLVPGTKIVRVDRANMIGNVVTGLKVSEEGLAWERRAKEKGLILPNQPWKLNGKGL